MNARHLVLAALVDACAPQALAQAPATSGASSTAVTAPGPAAGTLNEAGSRRQSIRSLPMDIKFGDTGISLPPSEPDAPAAAKAGPKAPDAAPKADTPGAAEKRN